MEQYVDFSGAWNTLWGTIAPDAATTVGLTIIGGLIALVVTVVYIVQWKRSKGDSKAFGIGLGIASLFAAPGAVIPLALNIVDVVWNIFLAVVAMLA